MSKMTFKRTTRGNLFARGPRGMGLTVYHDRLDGYCWRIHLPSGEDRFAELSFPSEDAALADLLDAVIEQQIIAGVLEEDDGDDFA